MMEVTKYDCHNNIPICHNGYLPLDIRLKEQTLPTDGSRTDGVHTISLTFSGDGVEATNLPLWWNDGEKLRQLPSMGSL